MLWMGGNRSKFVKDESGNNVAPKDVLKLLGAAWQKLD